MKLEQFTSGSSPSIKLGVSGKRCHNACIYYRNPYSSQKTWKIMKISWVFEEISFHASPGTLAVSRECCLGHFSWKIFSSFFQLVFWIQFLLYFVENFMLFWSKLDGYVWIQHGIADKTYENSWIFWWNRAKNTVQNRSWNFDENIFHQKCPKQHSLVTESVFGDACDRISSKNHDFFMLFHVFWLL